MKVSSYHFSCCYGCYANSGQFYRDRKKYFLRLLLAIFVPYFFSYYGFDFLSRFLLETKESQSIKLHGNRKSSDRTYRVWISTLSSE